MIENDGILDIVTPRLVYASKSEINAMRVAKSSNFHVYNMPKTAATTPMTPVMPTAGANSPLAAPEEEVDEEEVPVVVPVGLEELG